MRTWLRCAAIAAMVVSGSATAMDDAEFEKVLSRAQYKRYHVAVLEAGLEGDWNAALKYAGFLETRMPDDPETALMHAVIFAHLGNTPAALAWCERATQRGLHPPRLAAEAHNLLAPLAQNESFLAMTTRDLVHGPMLGHVTEHGASVWVRTAGVAEVTWTVTGKGVTKHATASTRAEDDYTAVLRLEDLEPATAYTYSLRVGDKGLRDDAWKFTTVDPNAKSMRVVFGGGAGYTPENERMWNTLRQTNPDLLLLLGDNVYIDNPTHPEIQRYCYYRRQSRPEFRRFVCATPVYAVWDDHDFGVNDCWYGSDPQDPAWKPDVLRIFTQNWVNPGYGRENAPGVWFRFDRGPLRVIMTDGRYYRSDPEGPSPTMLGNAQKSWLLDTIRESTDVPFVLLASGVPWAPGTKGDSLDTWDGYPAEREEIVSALDAANLKRLLLLSADRHRSELWKIGRPNGKSFYEFESSRLTNIHVHNTMPAALFSYNELQSFGMIDLDTTQPAMTLTIVNINGDPVYTMHLPEE